MIPTIFEVFKWKGQRGYHKTYKLVLEFSDQLSPTITYYGLPLGKIYY